jgi:acetoin utilization protein AcuC
MAAPVPPRDGRPILVFGPWSSRYDLGPAHPLTPRRFGPGIDLLTAVSEPGGPPRLLAPEPASDEALGAIHEASYIRTVRRFSDAPFGFPAMGIGPGDTPSFPGMHEAAAAVAGGSLGAMASIVAGGTVHAFHPGGGLHHAMPGRASGFCVYNDPALAIWRARRAGLRVLYVDLDVHHGDGVEAIHAADPGVLTLSIHQSGRTLFPGTGFVGDLGEGAAAGTSLNLPMDPGTGERGWLAALEAVLPPVAAAFGPDVVVSQHGADAHAWDPLANLLVTTTAMGAAARLVDAIVHRWAGGRWLATGGGGYDAYRVVPRAWSLVWLAARHAEHSLPTPAAWRARWSADAERYGQAPLPEWLEDEPNAGLRVDRAQEIAERRAIETAATLRELAVPAVVRAAVDLEWWDPLTGPVPGDRGAESSADPGRPEAAAGLLILDDVDTVTWARLRLAGGVLPLRDAAAGHALVLGALTSSHGVRATAAVAGDIVVGLALSAVEGAGRPRTLLALGVAASHRRSGLATDLLGRHVAICSVPLRAERVPAWTAVVTVAERDPVVPLPRSTRSRIARRLLEGAGFRVERAAGPVGAADPGAIVAHRP